MAADTLVARLRRDLTQLQLLYDLGAEISPEDFRRLVGSLGKTVNEVEDLIWTLQYGATAPLAGKEAVFAALKARFHTPPGVNRMQTRGHLGVIDGGRP